MKSSPQIPVAVFLTRFEPGGTARQMIELIRRLDQSRFRVHVVCFERAGAWLPRVAEHAASLVEFPITSFAAPSTVTQLLAFARWCRRERIAVVHTCDLCANIFGLPAAFLAGVPVRVGSRRELNPDKSAGHIALQRQAYRCATKVVANSGASRAILEREGLSAGSIAVIPNGVDAALFAGRSLEAALRPARSVLTVANLRPEKSHETLLAAAAMLVRDHPEMRFHIAGDGPRRHELEAMTSARGLGRHVTFLGHREDVAGLLEAADIFVLPSRSEAFPNSAIEAMAAGLPVVACATGGLLDLVANGRTGLLVPPGNAQALASAVRRLVADRPFASALGAAAREHVTSRYSFEAMVSAFEDLYLAGLPVGSISRAHRAQTAGI